MANLTMHDLVNFCYKQYEENDEYVEDALKMFIETKAFDTLYQQFKMIFKNYINTDNIDYDILIQGCRTGDREYIDEIVELLVETISIDRETVMIRGAEYPYQFVKNKLLKLNYSHIQYVLECLHDTTTKVRNVKAYLLTCLFNAPSTIGNYYRAEVNHDMYGGGWSNG